MKTEMEAARGAAFKWIFPDPTEPRGWAEHYFEVGFDAGWNARGSQWVAVKTVDDLPKENGIYNVRLRTFNKDGELMDEYSTSLFFESKTWMSDDGSELEYADVIAYMPIPPYTADSGQEGE